MSLRFGRSSTTAPIISGCPLVGASLSRPGFSTRPSRPSFSAAILSNNPQIYLGNLFHVRSVIAVSDHPGHEREQAARLPVVQRARQAHGAGRATPTYDAGSGSVRGSHAQY